MRYFQKKGNRSVGRNEAVKHSTGEIICCSDVGCTLDRDWLKNIAAPFSDKTIDVVSGYYKPVTTTVFERSLAAYTCVMPDKIDPKFFLPSSRSVAFLKSSWGKAGGYPEKIDMCEDLVFDKKMKQLGLKFHFVENALVYWPQRENIKEAFFQFFNYAKGDGQARYFRPQTPFLILRYFIAFLLIDFYVAYHKTGLLGLLGLFGVAYIVWAILKNYKYVKNLRALYILPALQLTSDIAVLSGMIAGFVSAPNK